MLTARVKHLSDEVLSLKFFFSTDAEWSYDNYRDCRKEFKEHIASIKKLTEFGMNQQVDSIVSIELEKQVGASEMINIIKVKYIQGKLWLIYQEYDSCH